MHASRGRRIGQASVDGHTPTLDGLRVDIRRVFTAHPRLVAVAVRARAAAWRVDAELGEMRDGFGVHHGGWAGFVKLSENLCVLFVCGGGGLIDVT